MPIKQKRLGGRVCLLAGLGMVIALSASQLALAKKHGPHLNTNASLVVATDKGRIKGIRRDGMREFLGIAYAAPPVGRARWAPPRPAKAWRGVRKADDFGHNCPQSPSPFGNPSVTEDCLYLNVYVPDGSAKHGGPRRAHKADKGRQRRVKRLENYVRRHVPYFKDHAPVHGGHRHRPYPVMVWLHGGAFVFGEGSDYDPAPLVKKGVIVVTLNYRLGMLGFLATTTLSAASTDHASGDYGLMDQQAALAWIKRNIAEFGGDSRNVTLFGVSAGGLSVLSQMASPKAVDLFQKAIIESGSYSAALPGLQPTLRQAEAQGAAFAAKVGCDSAGVACLRHLSVTTILAHQPNGPISVVPNTGTPILPQSVANALTSGDFTQVPVIEGTNATEWRLFTALAYDLTPEGPITRDQYLSAIQNSFFLPPAVAGIVAAQYPLASYPNPDLALSAAGTAVAFACPARREIGFLAAHVPTYVYEFADPHAPELFLPPVRSFAYGPTHQSEIQYFLDFTHTANLVERPAFTPDQRQLSTAMIDYWTQFARTGNPNTPSGALAFWPEYNNRAAYISLIPPKPETLSDAKFARAHRCRFWDDLVAGLSQPAP